MIFQSDEVKLTKKVNFVFYGFIFLKAILLDSAFFILKKYNFQTNKKIILSKLVR